MKEPEKNSCKYPLDMCFLKMYMLVKYVIQLAIPKIPCHHQTFSCIVLMHINLNSIAINRQLQTRAHFLEFNLELQLLVNKKGMQFNRALCSVFKYEIGPTYIYLGNNFKYII